MKKIFVLFIIIMSITPFHAQNYSNSTTLDSNSSEDIKTYARAKVKDLNKYITEMAKKENKVPVRLFYKKQALNLFIAKGERYVYEGSDKKGVTMETTSLYRKKPVRRLIRDYFDGVINYIYSRVEIEFSDIIELSDLKKIDDNTYVCTACYEQIFKGYRDGVPIYSDRTRKNVVIFVEVEETTDRIEYKVKLGDVTAVKTEKL